MSQLDDNLGAANLQLSGEQLAGLDELTTPTLIYPHWFGARVVDVQVREALKN
jgi:hypothetical protein